MTRGAQACMIVTAALPWYGMLSGSFLLYVFVLMAAAKLGEAAFAAFWTGVIPLVLLVLFVNPALLIAALAGNCSLPKPVLGAALTGTAITLMFSAFFTGISGLMAFKEVREDPAFAALAGLNAVVLGAGTWCAWSTARTLGQDLSKPARPTGGLNPAP